MSQVLGPPFAVVQGAGALVFHARLHEPTRAQGWPSNMKYGCALIAAVVLAILFMQSVVRLAGAGQSSARQLKWGRLIELENKRWAAMEESAGIEALRGEWDDEREELLA